MNRGQTAERRELLAAAPSTPVTVQFERALINELLSPQSLLEGWWTSDWTSLSDKLLSSNRSDNSVNREFISGRQPDAQLPSSETDTLITDPVRVTSITLTAGILWTLTRSGGLITTILMGVPAWRHVDLLPVLANQLEDDEPEDETAEHGAAAEMFDRQHGVNNTPAG